MDIFAWEASCGVRRRGAVLRSRGASVFLALSLFLPWPAARAAEFEINASSFTTDGQVNMSSVTYLGGMLTTPANPSATQLPNTPGGLYFDGARYRVWDNPAGAWVSLTTGTAGGLLPWSELTSFPGVCTGGQVVTGLGPALTCTTLPATSGSAGGNLAGSYPNPIIGPNVILSSHIANGAVGDAQTSLSTGAVLSGKFGDNRLAFSTAALAGGEWSDAQVAITTGAIIGGFNGSSQLVQMNGSGKLPAIDGSLLTNIAGTDSTRVLKAGDTMTGQLTLAAGSTITVTGNAFSVGGSTFVASGGNVGIGTTSPATKLQMSSGTLTIDGNVAASIRAAGSVQVGVDATACSAANAGAMRYNAGAFEGCNGVAWGAIGGTIPTGTVAFFNLSSCPATWTALTAAQGRYLVGLPPSGTLAGTDGTALTNLEDRPTGVHSHSVYDPGHTHTLYVVNGPSGSMGYASGSLSGASIATSLSYTGIAVLPSSGVAGTNAPYLQLLVCQKN